MTAGIPEGFHTVTPRLVAADPEGLVAFLRQAFGASGESGADSPVQLQIGDSRVMVSGADVREATSSVFYLYVEDARATYSRAIDAGAEPIEEPHIVPYGDLRGIVRDPAENVWQIATYNGVT